MNDDDFFGDDDLDHLPDNTLQQLEQHALTSTQRRVDIAAPASQLPHHQGYAGVGVTWRSPQLQHVGRPHANSHQPHAPPMSAPDPPSFDEYGLGDEDVIDLDEPSLAMHSASTLRGPMLSDARGSRHISRPFSDPDTAADAEMGASEGWAHAPHLRPETNAADDTAVLQARVAQLEAEQAWLRQSEQEARDATLAKQGEVSIVRANQDKVTKEYERRIAAMQRLHADEVTKQKLELEVERKERAKMETDNRFLQHDLAQEAERMRANVASRTRGAVPDGGTPRKSAKRANFGDGFEDDEVVLVVSPSKSKDRSRELTPKVGVKRKRQAQDSPGVALSFSQPSLSERQETSDSAVSTECREVPTTILVENERYGFMQRMLNHVPAEGHERTMDALSKYALPSSAGISLSSTLVEQLTRASHPNDTERLSVRLVNVLLDLWSRALKDKYYRPLYLLISLLRFALYLELSSTISRFVESVVPLCVQSIDVVVVPRFQALGNPAQLEETFHSLTQAVDVSEIMDLLQLICNASSLEAEKIELFWRHWDSQQGLLSLSKVQPMSHIVTALRMLATSALPTTWGPIAASAAMQNKQEWDLLDRATVLLFEPLQPVGDEPAYTDEEMADLRLEVIFLFKAMCLTDHGCLLLADHRNALGRIIRFLYTQVNSLYSLPPSLAALSISDESARPQIHDLVVQCINQTVKLVHYILTMHDAIDLVQKLQVVRGGYHKFLVSMTRIAFSEQLVFESGIEDGVTEAAHSILDDVLSPDEGEAVVKAVETPRGTRSTYSVRAASADVMDIEIGAKTAMSFPV